MADDKLAELLKTQKSLTEWLEDIKHKDVEAIRREDNEKRERLKILNKLIGLPFDKPTQFEATDLAEKTPAFTKYLTEHGEELCALRLNPKRENIPKLRMRGKTVAGAYAWFLEQAVNPTDYKADFIPHVEDNIWATIFIVNQHGIQGEIISGGHHQLTQGFHDDGQRPIVFRYDFTEWQLSPHDDDALAHLKKLAAFLHVPDQRTQQRLKDELVADFTHDYLEGYFETTDSPIATWFIDYNQHLGKLYEDVVLKVSGTTKKSLVSGQIGSPGKAKGAVHIVLPQAIKTTTLPAGSILVCPVTTPEYVPLMQQASAIVTDQGGILSHAAIVARELQKPCIVGTGNATVVLQEGQEVVVDADEGIVRS